MESVPSILEILMVCTGNICRSPMAEGLLRHALPGRLQHKVSVSSAGTHALVGNPAEPHARGVMADLGVDIQGHRARQVDVRILAAASLVLVMENQHHNWISDLVPESGPKVLLLGNYGQDRHQPEIPDPYGQGEFVYRACAQLIKSCLPGVIREIESLNGH